MLDQKKKVNLKVKKIMELYFGDQLSKESEKISNN